MAPPGAGKTTRVPPALAPRALLLLQPRRVAARAIARRIAEEQGLDARRGGRLAGALRAPLHGRARGSSWPPRASSPRASRPIRCSRASPPSCSTSSTSAACTPTSAWPWRGRPPGAPRRPARGRHVGHARPGPGGGLPGRLSRDRGPGRPASRSRWTTPRAARVADGVRQALARRPGGARPVLPARARREIRAGPRGARATCRTGVRVLPLHGRLAAEAQDAALRPCGGSARSSWPRTWPRPRSTVEGVTDVVDSGLHKVLRYDAERGFDRLETRAHPQDSAEQRAGRAGRTGPGPRPAPVGRRATASRPRREPEIERVDLAGPVLDVLAWGGDPALRVVRGAAAERLARRARAARAAGGGGGPAADRGGRRAAPASRCTRGWRGCCSATPGARPRAARPAPCSSERAAPARRAPAAADVATCWPLADAAGRAPGRVRRRARGRGSARARPACRRAGATTRPAERALLLARAARIRDRVAAGASRLGRGCCSPSGNGARAGPRERRGEAASSWSPSTCGRRGALAVRGAGAPRQRASSPTGSSPRGASACTASTREPAGAGRGARALRPARARASDRSAPDPSRGRAAAGRRPWPARPGRGGRAPCCAALRFAGLDARSRRRCSRERLRGLHARCRRSTWTALLALRAATRAVDRLAPETPARCRAAARRRARLPRGRQVAASVKLQELFGLAETPRLGPRQEPVLSRSCWRRTAGRCRPRATCAASGTRTYPGGAQGAARPLSEAPVARGPVDGHAHGARQAAAALSPPLRRDVSFSSHGHGRFGKPETHSPASRG